MSQQSPLALVYTNPEPPPKRPPPPLHRWHLPPPRPRANQYLQFILLSLLLHALVILLFGAPSGGSREGRAMWGSLRVDLPAPLPDAAPVLKLDTKLAPPLPKRSAPVRKAPQPEVPYTFPPLIDRVVVPERKLQMAPELKVPMPTPEQAPPPPPPEEIAPAPPAAPAPPPEVRAPEIPLPAPVPLIPVPPPIVLPEVQRVAPVELPPVPAMPVAPVQEIPVAPAVPERPKVEIPQVEAPRVEPAKVEPPKVEPPKVEPPKAEQPKVEQPKVEPPKVEPELRAPPVKAAPAPGPAPAPPAVAAPKRDEPSSGYDPTATPPSVDLDAIRNRASQLAREGSGQRAALPFPMPPIPERKTKEQIAIENARKPDCRTAYKDMGLLAVVPLVANQFGEGNCRW